MEGAAVTHVSRGADAACRSDVLGLRPVARDPLSRILLLSAEPPLRCPNPDCRRVLPRGPAAPGQRVTCPGCGASFELPVESAEAGTAPLGTAPTLPLQPGDFPTTPQTTAGTGLSEKVRRLRATILSARGRKPNLAELSKAWAGEHIGPYVVDELIGAGGFGLVLRAHEAGHSHPVALKVLNAHAREDARALKWFGREQVLLAKVTGRHVARILQMGSDAGLVFFAMDFVEGPSLRQMLRQSGGRLPIDTAVNLFGELLHGLRAIHGHGIVHRDLKPENILLDRRHGLRIVDFGCATALAEGPGVRRLVETDGETADSDGRLIVGTVFYMSPEQLAGEPIGPPSDLYSVGLVLCEMLTGKARMPDARDLREAAGDRAELLERLLQTLLEPDPSQRCRSAVELLQTWQQLFGETDSARRIGWAWRGAPQGRVARWLERWGIVLRITAHAAFLTALAAGFALSWHKDESVAIILIFAFACVALGYVAFLYRKLRQWTGY